MRCCVWAVVALLSLLVMPPSAFAAELIVSPNCARAWKFEVTGGAAATMREEAGALRFDITKRTDQNWQVLAYQPDKRVREGAQLTLRFKAKASAARVLGVNSQTMNSPWRTVLASYQNISLTTQWKDYTVPLTFKDVRSDTVRVPEFVLGDAAGTVWIKDVSVTDPTSQRFNAARTPTTVPTTAPSPVAASSPPPATMPSSASTEELLTRPLDPSSWRFEPQAETHATMVSESGMLRIDVGQASKDAWRVQLYQVPEAIAPGTYTLSLSVRSTTPRKMAFVIQQNGEPYELLTPYTQVDLGPEWKQYKIRFTLTKTFAGTTRAPVFQVGDAAGTVFIRSVSLVRSPAPAK